MQRTVLWLEEILVDVVDEEEDEVDMVEGGQEVEVVYFYHFNLTFNLFLSCSVRICHKV